MKKLLLFCAAVLTMTANAQHAVSFANAHWGFEADEASRPNYTTNTAFAIPTSWVVGTATVTSYRPYIYPNGNQTDKADQGHTGRYCLYMNQPNSASRLPVYAMLPTVSDKQMNTLKLELWARTFNSELDVNTSNTVYGDWKFGYITSLTDTVKANFIANVHYVQTIELTANWTKYTLDLKNFPANSYPVIYSDSIGSHNVRYAYIDDVKYVEGTTNPDPETKDTTNVKTTFTVNYTLSGCTAESENPSELTTEDEQITLLFTLAEGYTWAGADIAVSMGGEALTEDYNEDNWYYWTASEGSLFIYLFDGVTADLDVSITALKAIDFPTEFAPATFEDVTVGANGVYYDPNIKKGANEWLNGSFLFTTYYDNGYGDYYSDVVVSSNVDSTMAADYANPVSYLYAPTATPEGNNFAVWNQNFYGIANVKLGTAQPVSGMYVNNASAVINYIKDSYTSFPTNGYYMLTVTGYNEGVQTGTVNCYLIDWRDAQNKKTLTSWEWLSLTTLGNVDELHFDVDSDDAGQWGLNIPAYFCFDNLGGTPIVTGCQATTKAEKAEKVLRNGQVRILRGERIYDVAGQVVR